MSLWVTFRSLLSFLPFPVLLFLCNNSYLCWDKSSFEDWSLWTSFADIAVNKLMHTYNHFTCTSLYRLFRYSQRNANEGECLSAAPIQLLSGMQTAATWWTAKQSGSQGSEGWSGLYSEEWEKIDFNAEAYRVRCRGSMLNYLQTGIVAGDEQISDTH